MTRKRLLVDVDENQWAALKGQAAVEGRFVRVLLNEALAMYLARKAVADIPFFSQPPSLNPSKPTVEDLRALVAQVPVAHRPEPPSHEELRAMSKKDRAQLIADRQDYLRTHPEEEEQ